MIKKDGLNVKYRITVFVPFALIIAILFFISCTSANATPTNTSTNATPNNDVQQTQHQSDKPRIISFNLLSEFPAGEVDDQNNRIIFAVPCDVDMELFNNINFQVEFDGERIEPDVNQKCDFRKSVFFTVFAHNGTSRTYEVCVCPGINDNESSNSNSNGDEENSEQPGRLIYKDTNMVECTISVNGQSESLFVSKTEIDQAIFEETVRFNNSKNKNPILPVTNLTWYETLIFCNLLSDHEGKTPVYIVDGRRNDFPSVPGPGDKQWKIEVDKDADGYRLPTEAELKQALSQSNDVKKLDSTMTEWYFDWPESIRRDKNDPKITFRVVCK